MYFFNRKLMPSIKTPSKIECCFDRTRTLFDIPEIEPISKVGTLTSVKSFKEIADERAAHIANVAKSEDKNIAVYWSGGIDSTVALVAMRKAVPDASITVVLTKASVDEHPAYFDLLKASSVKLMWEDGNTISVTNSMPELLKTHVVVTGELGDQVFGNVRYVFETDTSIFLRPWKDELQKSAPNSIEKYEIFAGSCPYELKTLKEFWWWFSYCVKWQTVAFRMILGQKDAILEKNVFHFFDGEGFNNWAVSTPMEQRFYGTDVRKYKWDAKEYIYDQHKDQDYLKTKIKEVSLNITPNDSESNWVKTDWTRGI